MLFSDASGTIHIFWLTDQNKLSYAQTLPDNLDSPAVWQGPEGPRLLVTAKSRHRLAVYDAVTGATVLVAARVLGVSGPGVFLRVTLPLAWRGVLAGTLLAFARSMGEFGATLMVAGSIPGKTQTLSIAVYEAVQAGQDDTANLLVLITSATCVLVLVVASRLAPRRVVVA